MIFTAPPLDWITTSGSRARNENRATFSSPSTDSSRNEYLLLPAILKYAETGVSRSPDISRYTGIRLPCLVKFKNSFSDKSVTGTNFPLAADFLVTDFLKLVPVTDFP